MSLEGRRGRPGRDLFRALPRTGRRPGGGAAADRGGVPAAPPPRARPRTGRLRPPVPPVPERPGAAPPRPAPAAALGPAPDELSALPQVRRPRSGGGRGE